MSLFSGNGSGLHSADNLSKSTKRKQQFYTWLTIIMGHSQSEGEFLKVNSCRRELSGHTSKREKVKTGWQNTVCKQVNNTEGTITQKATG